MNVVTDDFLSLLLDLFISLFILIIPGAPLLPTGNPGTNRGKKEMMAGGAHPPHSRSDIFLLYKLKIEFIHLSFPTITTL